MSEDGWNPALYQSSHSFVWERGSDLIALLDAQPCERILDMGCGTGQLTAKIAESGAAVVGIDSSEAMIEAARANYPEIQFFVSDVRDYRSNEAFDAVVSNAVLHWVKPPELAAESIALAVKPGGRFIAEFGSRYNVAHILMAVQRAFPTLRNPWYFPSIAEYSNLMDSAGLEVSHAFHFPRMTALEDGEEGL